MAKSLIELHREQGRLLERIAGQRGTLARHWQPLQALSDRGAGLQDLLYRGLNFVCAHPLPWVAGATAVIVLSPRRALRWARRGWFVWRTGRRLMRLVPASLWQQLLRKPAVPDA
jgi:hypothetical protein